MHAHRKLTLKENPSLIDESNDPRGISFYHHLLQRALLGWLQLKYPATWEVAFLPHDLGESRGYFFESKSVPSKVYTGPELVHVLAGNKFADRSGPFGPSRGLALPRQTELKITAPHQDSERGEIGRIVLSNSYCELTIETRQAGGRRGIGSYAFVFGLADDQANLLWTHQYSVIINASFARFLAGSPDMPRYKKWATDIAEGLEAQFNEQGAWSRIRDYYLLHGTMHLKR